MAGMSAEPSVSATGDPFWIVGADAPFGFNSNWRSPDFHAFFTGDAGVKALNVCGTALSMSGSYDGLGDTNFQRYEERNDLFSLPIEARPLAYRRRAESLSDAVTPPSGRPLRSGTSAP
jgi:hypothetical protein